MESKSLQKSVSSLVSEMSSKKILSQDDYLFAAEWLKRNKTTQKSVKDHFSSDLEEAETKVKEIKKSRDVFLKPLLESETIVKKQLLDYDLKIQEEKEEAERKLLAAQEKGLSDKTIRKYETALDSASSAPPKVDGISTRKDWTFEILDESLIPRSFLMPDGSKLSKHAKLNGDSVPIPGVRFFQKSTIVSRRG